MIKEFCTKNYTSIPLTIARGANRIELCDNLAVGGTALDTGVIEETLSYAGEKNIPVTTIIRPRGGDFVYNDIELGIIHTDLIGTKKLGTDGAVFGCLTSSGWLDEEASGLLIKTAEGVQIIFYVVSDSIPGERQFEAINWLAAHGVDRILTHDGPADRTTEEHFPRLKELIDYTDGCLIILPGGGIAAASTVHTAKELNVDEVHGTRVVELQL